MIDIKLLRENPELIRESQKKRGCDPKEVDKILELDKKWRELKLENDKLRSERNKISMSISEAKKQKDEKKVEEIMKSAKIIPEKLKINEEETIKTDNERMHILENIPNLIDASCPLGDSTHNKTLETFGKPTKFKFKVKGHEELLTSLDLLDMERAAKVSGSRFYYLKGDLVRLNFGIMNFALDFLKDRKFVLVQPPYMLNRKALGGAITLGAFEDMIYKIEGEDLYLIGTAEHALNAYYMDEVLEKKDLPIRFAGISPCFRKEAGTTGKDTKGIFRVHQFDKVEQFVFCKPEEAWKEFDFLMQNTTDLFSALEIPFKTVLLSGEDTGRVPTKTIDFEGWFPSGDCYRELASCSNCLDYQARRSNIRYQDKDGMKFVYTLNNTAISITRMLVCLIENNQQEDGSIKIPKALWPYTGFKVIEAEKEVKEEKSVKKIAKKK